MSPILEYIAAGAAKLRVLSQDARVDYKGFALSFGALIWAFESYLVLRQLPLYSRPVPAHLADHITPEKLAKAQAYGRDKAVFSLVNLLWSQINGASLIYFDGFARVWTYSAGLVPAVYQDGILHSMLYGTLLTLLMYLPTIPISLYQTFVIEERHGFNKSTIGLFLADMLKGQLVFAAIGLPFLAGFLKIVAWAGDSFVGWLMIFFIGFQLILATIFPTFIQPLFNKFTPLPEGPVRDKVLALSDKLKFPLKHLYEIDGSKRSGHSNAYFYGLPWSKHIVIYDTLIAKSKPEEVEAVLAHELGHWSMSHPTKLLLLSQIHLLTTLTLLHLFLRNPQLLRSFGFPALTCAHPPIMVGFILSQLVNAPIDSVFQLGLNAVTRKFEYEADQFACEIGENMGKELGEALKKLHIDNLATVNTDWMYSAYHNNHPTLTERLKAMESFRADYYGSKKLKLKSSAPRIEKKEL